ncbi:transcription factor bHLH118-like [Solanum tuberosum]|uniref:transcription factor bHLH118-like n=1 Tax=Solanum tuberosum TaxID=4113 RepID=UPI0003D28C7E|nr:PREDICTED: transcription factor bHLH118-like [Solanum tuberosum]
MDCLSEIFSSKKIKDHDQQQLIQIPSTPCQPHHQDLATNDPNYKRKRSISDHKERDSLTRKNSVQKRVLHRDVERHRRQEMSNLYATLRSHLPYESIKGKRSLPDDMQEAVNYIKNLENNIKELEIKRKKLEDLALCSSKEDKHFGDYVTINLCDCGVEILINEKVPLSRVLEELVKRQLNVVNCVSTKVNERLLHRIQLEEGDVSCMCIDGLEQKLAEMIVFHS